MILLKINKATTQDYNQNDTDILIKLKLTV